jgi:hypothetical protein
MLHTRSTLFYLIFIKFEISSFNIDEQKFCEINLKELLIG